MKWQKAFEVCWTCPANWVTTDWQNDLWLYQEMQDTRIWMKKVMKDMGKLGQTTEHMKVRDIHRKILHTNKRQWTLTDWHREARRQYLRFWENMQKKDICIIKPVMSYLWIIVFKHFYISACNFISTEYKKINLY